MTVYRADTTEKPHVSGRMRISDSVSMKSGSDDGHDRSGDATYLR